MRPGQNKRMRGRNRRGPNPLTRSYESNGPDVKVRGTAQHIAEKYTQLARDAHLSGDPVSAESYLQHAEHYYRLIASAVQSQQAALSGAADEREDEDEDFDTASDRFTFRAPQSMQQPNQNGGGFYGPGQQGEGEGAEGEAGEGQPAPQPQREGGFQQHNRDNRGRDDRQRGRHDRDRDRDRGRDRFRDNERFQPQPPRRPQPEVVGTGEQPDLPAFLTTPARAVGPESDVEVPSVDIAVEGEEGRGGPFRARRRRRGPGRGRPGEPGYIAEGGEGDA